MIYSLIAFFVDDHKAELEAETGLTFVESGIGRGKVRLDVVHVSI